MHTRTFHLLLLLATMAALAAGCGGTDDDTSSSAASKAKMEQADAMDKDDAMKKDDAMEKTPAMEKHSSVEGAHFVSSDPANGATVAANSLDNITLTFDFDLATGSKVLVTRDGADATTGPTKIVGDKLQLMVPVSTAQAGSYRVAYTGCWPDGSCHDGSFGFNVKG